MSITVTLFNTIPANFTTTTMYASGSCHEWWTRQPDNDGGPPSVGGDNGLPNSINPAGAFWSGLAPTCDPLVSIVGASYTWPVDSLRDWVPEVVDGVNLQTLRGYFDVAIVYSNGIFGGAITAIYSSRPPRKAASYSASTTSYGEDETGPYAEATAAIGVTGLAMQTQDGSTLTVRVEWGDGSDPDVYTPTGGTGVNGFLNWNGVSGTHRYRESGSYFITVTEIDSWGRETEFTILLDVEVPLPSADRIGTALDAATGTLFTAVNEGSGVRVSQFKRKDGTRLLLALVANATNPSLVQDATGRLTLGYEDRNDGAYKTRHSGDSGRAF